MMQCASQVPNELTLASDDYMKGSPVCTGRLVEEYADAVECPRAFRRVGFFCAPSWHLEKESNERAYYTDSWIVPHHDG